MHATEVTSSQSRSTVCPTALTDRWRVTAVSGGALLLSAFGSWRPSMWGDEGVTISIATRSWPQLWQVTGLIDAVHSVYYSLLHLWFAVVGVNAFTLRLPSAVFIALATWTLIRLTERWGSSRMALTAGVVFAVLPRTTWMGLEGRPWALATLLAVTSTLFLLRWLQRRRWYDLVGYALVLGLGISVELYLVFLAMSHAVTLLLLHRTRHQLVPPAAAMVVAGLVASPIILRAMGQGEQILTSPLSLVTWLRQLLVNQNFAGEPIGPAGWLTTVWQPAAAALALASWVLVGWLVWHVRRTLDRDLAVLLGWCLPWLVLPSLVVMVWTLVSRNMYNPRYFSFCAPAMAILLAAAVITLLDGRWRAVVSGILVVLLVPGYLAQRTVHAKSGADWSSVSAYVQRTAEPGDGVFFADKPSTRLIAIAYPQSFAGLVDVTLARDAASSTTLAGTNRPLEHALTTAPAQVWAIWRSDDDDFAADLATFARAGYVQRSRWSSTKDVVLGFHRS